MENKISTIPYKSKYRNARQVSYIISFFGWLIVFGGIVGIFVGLDASGSLARSGMLRGDAAAIAAMLPGVLISITGLVVVAAGQIVRATVDNADNTGEMLSIMKNTSS